MYVCTCVCIHAHLCHVYIVCHEYIDTCIYLYVVHLDIILLIVSDGDDSTKGWKSLFENPGVTEVHELIKFLFILGTTVLFTKSSDIPLTLVGENTSSLLFWWEKNRDFETKGVDLYPPRGTLRNGKGTGIKGTRRFL